MVATEKGACEVAELEFENITYSINATIPVSNGEFDSDVTVTGSSGAGFVAVYPCGTLPPTSSVNFAAGQTVANAVITPLSSTGTVCVYSNVPVDVLVDVNGYFDAPTTA